VTELLRDQVRIAAPRERIWAVFWDAAALARVLPGCESLEESAPGRYRGILGTRIQFLTLRAEVTAALQDALEPRSVRLELSGKPIGLIGSFRVLIPVELDEHPGGTVVSYQMDLQSTGRLAAFGAPLLRDTARRQVAQLVRNLEREVAAGPEAGPDAVEATA
jgi:carbon monoxide dehydrogenase subunit G